MIPFALQLFALGMMVTVASAEEDVRIPEFFASDCMDFRYQLLNHSTTSFYDRRHATRVGIASMALFWTGIPAIPLGISAIWMGRRISTPALRALKSSGVSSDNYQRVNKLCATLLRKRPLEDVSFQGRSSAAIAMGAVALGLSLFAFVVQTCYGVIVFVDSGKRFVSDSDSSSDTDSTYV
ncbi:hypothetical protein BWQ96_04434 [Gracilariopsis chorda]|uniref:Uncharacterized protein n=1 Tax=Gracilariopsis chorda TaxID=448386 RepID=A0A2V3IUM8_9FLOR|nr:hypothetical protein BWQ96_04434 [Gracilariopsis chorda]|eukprot:PXF45822.1 hypothetical protein BWQ96_04434 [Gracilariopsis chorda]